MARQGHAFATALEVRVVYQGDDDKLVDVPNDGKTIGEIVTRGNIVMKEVLFIQLLLAVINLTRSTVLQRFRCHSESFQGWLLWIRRPSRNES